jgi:hypothetical protein
MLERNVKNEGRRRACDQHSPGRRMVAPPIRTSVCAARVAAKRPGQLSVRPASAKIPAFPSAIIVRQADKPALATSSFSLVGNASLIGGLVTRLLLRPFWSNPVVKKSDNSMPDGSKLMNDVTSTYDETIKSVIDREYGSLRNGAKILARHAKSSLAAAQHWIYGRRVPTGENLLNIMAESPGMYDEINRLISERRASIVKTNNDTPVE